MRLHALSAGVEAPTRCFSGVIHSIFHHACNVSLASKALLTLVSSEQGNLSQGIRLGTPPKFTFLDQLRVGQPVACRGGILRISGSELSVDLRTARLWHSDLKGLRVDLRQCDTAQAWAVAWLELENHRRGNGITAMIAALSVPRQNPVTSPAIMALVERAVHTVSALIEMTRTLQIDGAITAIRPLIGLGPGLTPSGDDFIVGYLAGLWSTGGSESSRVRFLSSLGAWLSQAAAGTNAISRTYIQSAINGNVSEPLATLAQRVGHPKNMDRVREAARTALQVGNTSGADGVLGLLLGCLAWAAPSLHKQKARAIFRRFSPRQEEQTMLPVKRFHWATPEYADAFTTFLKYTGERMYVRQILRGIFSLYPAESRAIDWGAGEGDLTRLMLEHFQHVYAVEPHQGMRAVLATRYPCAQVFDGTLISTIPPTPVAVGLISHVFYHVPDHKWGAYTIHAANQLTEDGVLAVTLKDPDSGCNQMLEYFGAPRYNIYDGLARVMRLHTEFDFSFTRVPGSISTPSFDDTLQIARFMLCDRDADAFSHSPTEEEFQEYVREHFWDERSGTGGWHYEEVVCFVRRNAVHGKQPEGRR